MGAADAGHPGADGDDGAAAALGHGRRRAATPHAAAVQRPDPGLLRVMRTLDHVPVLLLGHRGEVLARNGLLMEVLGRPLEPGTSFVRFMFPQDFASATVATMRRETARRPHDTRLTVLVDELRTTDADVARWWDDHAVRDYASVAKRIQHPTAGPLTFDIEIVCAPNEPDQRLVVYTCDPDSTTARVLPILAGWTTAPHL
ncbi:MULTISPECIES: hypothetical protein [unclassified Streptomyces]|uniref:MmyB family transcriptional regulator n=1 Tax=unclassified Streptomyces TaxID=2593676 RepID=UPI0003A591AE|nr:hypothetical protein [Streptomyces sp. BoleA5]